MVFSDLFFLLFFFIVYMALFYSQKTVRGQNAVLLAFSLLFYAWSGLILPLLLCAMTLICWISGRLLSGIDIPFYRKAVMSVTVAACLLILVFFKFLNPLAQGMQALFHFQVALPDIVLPIGLSFYTLSLLSYVADVYRGRVTAQKSYWKLLLYAALFHKCAAGPIVRYGDLCTELDHRTVCLSDISAGITRFSIGLAKKALLANHCASLADAALSAEGLVGASSGTVLLGTLFYMLQIYLDLSAYSDMAIGMGMMCGLHYGENFRYPYCAGSLPDFWSRWHISLSGFFCDYVYKPLKKDHKRGRQRVFDLLTVWILVGLWHGASWNYLLWSVYHFLLLVGDGLLWGRETRQRLAWQRLLRRIGTLVAVWFGWILFYFEDLSLLANAVFDLFGKNGFWDSSAGLLFLNNVFFLAIAVLACTPVVSHLLKKVQIAAEGMPAWRGLAGTAAVAAPVLLLLLSFLTLVGDGYRSFLYFQF